VNYNFEEDVVVIEFCPYSAFRARWATAFSNITLPALHGRDTLWLSNFVWISTWT